MAADVSSLVRLLSRYDRDDGGGGAGGDGNHKADLVTRDLLGGGCVVGGGGAPAPGPKKAPYPDLHALTGGDKRRLQAMDLNLPPLWPSAPAPPVRTAAVDMSAAPVLELKLRSLAAPPPAEYQSVCTLEKVRSALERAERESRRKQQQAGSPSPSSSSTTTSSAKRRLPGGSGAEEGDGESMSPPEMEKEPARRDGPAAGGRSERSGAATEMAAAGCPSCLMYVLISRSNPRCPRCSAAVPLPLPPQAAAKKPRIDLNAATSSAVTAAASTPMRTVNFF